MPGSLVGESYFAVDPEVTVFPLPLRAALLSSSPLESIAVPAALAG
ncbi:hypothetical protein [Rhodococcus sp. NPDC047139]